VNDCVGFGMIHSTSGSTFSLQIATQIASCTIIGTLKAQIYYKIKISSDTQISNTIVEVIV